MKQRMNTGVVLACYICSESISIFLSRSINLDMTVHVSAHKQTPFSKGSMSLILNS